MKKTVFGFLAIALIIVAVLGYERRESPDKIYYESGQLQAEEIYKDDKREGPYKRYYESGQLEAEGTYKDGKLEGPYKWYYESGELKEEGTYKDEKLEGKFSIYRKNGTVAYIDTCRAGKRINRKAYDESGKLESDQDY